MLFFSVSCFIQNVLFKNSRILNRRKCSREEMCKRFFSEMLAIHLQIAGEEKLRESEKENARFVLAI